LAHQTNDKHRAREKQALSERTPGFHSLLSAQSRASFPLQDHSANKSLFRNLRAFRPDGMQNQIMGRPFNGGND